ncbi:MAG: hydroxyacylglutathione hydrolase [Pseudohongiellaceae bacterium]
MQTEIIPVPAFTDNYIWLIREPDGPLTWIVDPGDAVPVLERLTSDGLQAAGILLTHHHPDHTGGVDELLARFDIPVYGPRSRRIPQVTRPLAEGDSVTVLGHRATIIEVPGHTLDHIAFHFPMTETPGAAPMLFCGDTLFAGGCGRLFEGDPEMMHDSLSRLAALSPDSRVYCAHEYTRANLVFASAAEPENAALQQRLASVEQLRAENRITLPSTLSTELRTNPFLRCHSPVIVQQLTERLGSPPQGEVETFAALRQWKDNF